MTITRTAWGTLPSGEQVDRLELSTDAVRLGVLTWGATVQSLAVPGPRGWDDPVDVVLGFDRLEPYLGDQPYLGATVGRYANRIAGGAFDLDGTTHRLPLNDGANTLHGGPGGFAHRGWRLDGYDDESVTLSLVSADGDMGFPGRVEITTVFRVAGAVVTHETTATTDAPTVLNITNHAYFNLHGTPRPVDDHVLTVPAGCYLPVDDGCIPLAGPPTCVADTPFDFRRPRPIGASAYDHTLVLAEGPITLSAGGRTLTVTTSEPGVQLYTGDHLDGSLRDRAGAPIGPRGGVCLETQHFPDSPNRPDYPSTVLRPGETFRSVTEWRVEADTERC
ncbi:MAG: galactose mutarotase [Nocardioidaceae bacterium]|nr:galactose mutarotase [Nocardioidaceae bacterium]MCL2613306.1 galactose mutarotase [Nocardioidaceae bacterium]